LCRLTANATPLFFGLRPEAAEHPALEHIRAGTRANPAAPFRRLNVPAKGN
jgi:hypothetical protein